MKKKLRLSTSILRKAGASQTSIPSYWDAESAADEYHTHYKPYIERLHALLRSKRQGKGAHPDDWQIDTTKPENLRPTPDPKLTDSHMAAIHHTVRALLNEGILSPFEIASKDAISNPETSEDEHHNNGDYSLQDWSKLHGTKLGQAGMMQGGGRLYVNINHKLADGTTVRIPFYFSTGLGGKDKDDGDSERVPKLGFYPHAGTGSHWIHKDTVKKERGDYDTPRAGMTNSYHNPVIAYYKGILDSTLGKHLKEYGEAVDSYGRAIDTSSAISPSYATYDIVKGSGNDTAWRERAIARKNSHISDWISNPNKSADDQKFIETEFTGPTSGRTITDVDNPNTTNHGRRWQELIQRIYDTGGDRTHIDNTTGRYMGWLSSVLNKIPSRNKSIEQNGVRMPNAPTIGTASNPNRNPSAGLTEQHPMVAHAIKTYDIGKKFGSDLMSRLTPKAPQSPTLPSPAGQPASKSFSPFPFAIWSPAYT